MKFDDYQVRASKFAIYKSPIPYLVYGLTSEVGEVAALFKRKERDGTTVDRDKLALELGDCLWYISQIAHEYDIWFGEVAVANLDKLSGRALKGTLQGSGDNR